MNKWIDNIENVTLKNDYYRRVIYTTENQQLVVMKLKPKTEIGMEIHENNDQFIRIESGYGLCQIGNQVYQISENYAFVVPRGTVHNVINESESQNMYLYTIYSPPLHKPNEIQYEAEKRKRK